MNAKRLFDFSVAICGLLALLPLLIALAAIIRLQGDGTALLRQRRVGKDAVPFTLLKFRTMRTNAPQVGTHEISEHFITPIGRLLRKTKLDELPQLVNVIRGDMSLVGPRPCLPSQTELIEQRQRRNVFSVRPGITGWSQIQGIDMRDAEKLANADAVYVATQNLAGDLVILFRTFFKTF